MTALRGWVCCLRRVERSGRVSSRNKLLDWLGYGDLNALAKHVTFWSLLWLGLGLGQVFICHFCSRGYRIDCKVSEGSRFASKEKLVHGQSLDILVLVGVGNDPWPAEYFKRWAE